LLYLFIYRFTFYIYELKLFVLNISIISVLSKIKTLFGKKRIREIAKKNCYFLLNVYIGFDPIFAVYLSLQIKIWKTAF